MKSNLIKRPKITKSIRNSKGPNFFLITNFEWPKLQKIIINSQIWKIKKFITNSQYWTKMTKFITTNLKKKNHYKTQSLLKGYNIHN